MRPHRIRLFAMTFIVGQQVPMRPRGRFHAKTCSPAQFPRSRRPNRPSNRLLGFTQTLTSTRAGRSNLVSSTSVSYGLDAAGNLTSDGLRSFDYDASNRLSANHVFKNDEAAIVRQLHNAAGQRVFKSEPQAQQTLPQEETLGVDFVTWLKKQFGWLFAQAQANAER